MSCDTDTTAGMRMLIPKAITGFTSTIPETEYSAWAAGTYALGARVIVLSEHNIYESLENSNTDNPTGGTSVKWALVGKTNAWKCVDPKISTQSITTTSMTVTMDGNNCPDLVLLNIEAAEVTVEVLDADDIVIHTEVRDGYKRDVYNVWTLFFAPFEHVSSMTFTIPIVVGGTVRITLTGSTVKLGVVDLGSFLFIGSTLWNANFSFVDYSVYEEDRWGDIVLKEGNIRDTFEGIAIVNTNRLSYIRKMLQSRRGKLTTFVPTTAYDMTLRGFVREPQIVWETARLSHLTLDIQGTI